LTRKETAQQQEPLTGARYLL